MLFTLTAVNCHYLHMSGYRYARMNVVVRASCKRRYQQAVLPIAFTKRFIGISYDWPCNGISVRLNRIALS